MKTSSRPCPQCASAVVKRIVWTEDAARLAAASGADVAYLLGPSLWNATAEIDRICTQCEKRFCNDLATQARYDEDGRRRLRRIEAQRRGDFLFAKRGTPSDDEIALQRTYDIVPRSERVDNDCRET